MKSVFTVAYTWFLILCSYLCLWVISDYLLSDATLAFLFLPFALRCGINLHIPKKYWFIAYAAEYSILLLLILSFPELNAFSLFLISLLSFPITSFFYTYYMGSQWQKLLVQLSFIIVLSLISSLVISHSAFYFTFLVSFTGGILIIPTCYLLHDFLFNTKWLPLTATLVKKPITLRTKHILMYIVLFTLNIYIQTTLPNEFYRFALFCLAIPIILLAFQYGWQGAFLGTLLNSIALITAMHSFSNLEIADLFLSISVQSITGIFLGLGIQYQRNLNQSLSIELERNKNLTRQLINSEEAIRKEISRELHDEIGQNITAIRTQASILKRVSSNANQENIATTIEHLSLNVYDTTKGLLNRIRPKLLDDLELQEALENLFIELDFEHQGIDISLHWENPQQLKLEHVLEITIYRLCQESLNNIIKYSHATEASISIQIFEQINIIIQDNGIGFDLQKEAQGFGIRGMKERVKILCGEFKLISKQIEHDEYDHGTKIIINLPRF